MRQLLSSSLLLSVLLFYSCGSSPVVKKKPVVRKPKEISFKKVNYLKTGKLIKVSSVYTGSNSLAAIGDSSGNIYIYTCPALFLKKRIPSRGTRLIGMDFHDSGKKITAAYSGGIIVTYRTAGFSTAPLLTRKGRFGQLRCLAAHPVKDRILLGNGKGEVLQFSRNEKEPVRKKTGLKSVNYIRFSPDGKKIALAGRRNLLTLDSDGLDRDDTIRTGSPVISFAFSPDSSQLAAGTLFFRAILLKASSLSMKNSYEISMDPVSSLLFRPREKWLITGSGKTGKGTLHVLSLPDLKLKKKERFDTEEIIRLDSLFGGSILAISSDGTLLLLQSVY